MLVEQASYMCGCYDLVREQTEQATMYVIAMHGQGLSSYLIKSIVEQLEQASCGCLYI